MMCSAVIKCGNTQTRHQVRSCCVVSVVRCNSLVTSQRKLPARNAIMVVLTFISSRSDPQTNL
jgi:hypothetical protein